jgi:hypothetical protein
MYFSQSLREGHFLSFTPAIFNDFPCSRLEGAGLWARGHWLEGTRAFTGPLQIPRDRLSLALERFSITISPEMPLSFGNFCYLKGGYERSLLALQGKLLQIKLGSLLEVFRRLFNGLPLACCPHLRALGNIHVLISMDYCGKCEYTIY